MNRPGRDQADSDSPAGVDRASIDALTGRFPRGGQIVWIGVRPQRLAPLKAVLEVEALAGAGLDGDHYGSRAGGNRQVTLIQAEHLAVVGALLGEPPIEPRRLRRNLVVSGINLLALKQRRFRVGSAVLQGTGLAHPCSRMERELGPGGYNAMRGHGGITARVVGAGVIRVGDAVLPTEDALSPAGER